MSVSIIDALGSLRVNHQMNYLKEFRNLEGSEFGFLVFAVGGAVCPGILAIWLFDPNLIVELTTPKLILLAVSIMLPYVGLNSWILGMTTGVPSSTPRNKIYIQLFLQASVVSLCLFLGCLFIRFFLDISLHAFLIILASQEIVFLLFQLGQRQSPPQNQESTNPGGEASEANK
jgi:hypothetical protein